MSVVSGKKRSKGTAAAAGRNAKQFACRDRASQNINAFEGIFHMGAMKWRAKNYLETRDKLDYYVTMKLDSVGCIINPMINPKNKKPSIPMITREDGTRVLTTNPCAIIRYKVALGSYKRRKARLSDSKKKLYGMLMLALSLESLAAVREDVHFAQAHARRSPLKLMKIIHRVHMIGNSIEDRMQRQRVKSAWRDIQQGYRENDSEFYSRFKAEIERYDTLMTHIGQPLLSKSEQTDHFILALNQRHTEYKRAKYNKLGPYPASIHDVMCQLRTFIEPDYSHEELYWQNFVRNLSKEAAAGEQQTKSRDKGTRNRTSTVGDCRAAANATLRNKKRNKKCNKKNDQCRNCGEYGHWMRDCPEKEAEKEGDKLVSEDKTKLVKQETESVGTVACKQSGITEGTKLRAAATARARASYEIIKQDYTKKQIRGAEKALELRACLAYPSDAQLIQMITGNHIVGTDVTVEDVHRARAIFGNDRARRQLVLWGITDGKENNEFPQ